MFTAGGHILSPVTYLVLKYLHILGAVVLLGTGAGIAFFMLMAHRSRDAAFVARTAGVVVLGESRDAAFVARTAGVVVLGDMIFTAAAVVMQPLTGYLLVRETGFSLGEPWLLASLFLYGVAGGFWLPVVWMQARMRDLAVAAAAAGEALPASYHRLFRWWFAFGFPGFGAVMLIVWLMVAKPSL